MKVLVIDDSKTFLNMVTDILTLEGFEVIQANDGKEGMFRLLKNPVDLIITDLHMPYIDGIELLRRVKRSQVHKQTPVIMLTTESQKTRVMEALTLGVSGWILKPFTQEQLMEIVKKVIQC